ncbi:MAG: DUF4249 family protein [Bacteroidota bacterium]
MRRFVLLLTLVSLAACDSVGSSEYVEQVVVSSFLEVGKRPRPVNLTRTFPLEGPVDLARALVTDATVSISLLAPDGSVEATYPLEFDGTAQYRILDTEVRVLPGRTYRFTAEVPGQGTITAETITPTPIDLVQPAQETVTYLDGLGPTFRVTPASVPNRQSVYLIQVAAQAPDDFEVIEREDGSFGVQRLFTDGRFGPTPDAASFIENIDCDRRDLDSCDFLPSDLASGSSPLLNQESYESFPDGSIQVTVPWLAFGFYGPHKFTLNALDAVLTDYIATQAVQFNPTTLSPGEIPNITSNVEGGLGVFGAYAAVEVFSTVVPE